MATNKEETLVLAQLLVALQGRHEYQNIVAKVRMDLKKIDDELAPVIKEQLEKEAKEKYEAEEKVRKEAEEKAKKEAEEFEAASQAAAAKLPKENGEYAERRV